MALQKKRILVCPLNWGLGHARRCIPIINALLELRQDVIIASDGDALELLKQEFPQLRFYSLPSYGVYYPKDAKMLWAMLRQLPKINNAIKEEHLEVESIVESERVDVVISDNRYGAKAARTKNIFLTHQLWIKTPILSSLINRIHHFFITSFDECWVPDFPDSALSGELSSKITPFYTSFMGPLSSFKRLEKTSNLTDLLVILSGPEPQRTILEKEIINQLINSSLRTILLKGTAGAEKEEQTLGNITIYPHLKGNELNKLIQGSNVVLCRSGYTSIMDLLKLNKKAILIPTPGQTEQEYLAHYHKNKPVFIIQQQGHLAIKSAYYELLSRTVNEEMVKNWYSETELKNFLTQKLS